MTFEDQLTNSTAISIIYEEHEDLDGAKGLGDIYESVVKRVGTLNVAVFRERLSALCLELSELFNPSICPLLHIVWTVSKLP